MLAIQRPELPDAEPLCGVKGLQHGRTAQGTFGAIVQAQIGLQGVELALVQDIMLLSQVLESPLQGGLAVDQKPCLIGAGVEHHVLV